VYNNCKCPLFDSLWILFPYLRKLTELWILSIELFWSLSLNRMFQDLKLMCKPFPVFLLMCILLRCVKHLIMVVRITVASLCFFIIC
jgi:hypothetical protein